jgi:peptide chain release factor subunit 3
VWLCDRYDEIAEKITPFLKSIGYNPKTDISYLPVSGFTGANLKERSTAEICPWYQGPSIIELLDNLQPLNRNDTVCHTIAHPKTFLSLSLSLSTDDI